jgi:hypothetical protein
MVALCRPQGPHARRLDSRRPTPPALGRPFRSSDGELAPFRPCRLVLRHGTHGAVQRLPGRRRSGRPRHVRTALGRAARPLPADGRRRLSGCRPQPGRMGRGRAPPPRQPCGLGPERVDVVPDRRCRANIAGRARPRGHNGRDRAQGTTVRTQVVQADPTLTPRTGGSWRHSLASPK